VGTAWFSEAAAPEPGGRTHALHRAVRRPRSRCPDREARFLLRSATQV